MRRVRGASQGGEGFVLRGGLGSREDEEIDGSGVDVRDEGDVQNVQDAMNAPPATLCKRGELSKAPPLVLRPSAIGFAGVLSCRTTVMVRFLHQFPIDTEGNKKCICTASRWDLWWKRGTVAADNLPWSL